MITGKTFIGEDVHFEQHEEYSGCSFTNCKIYGSDFSATNCTFATCAIECTNNSFVRSNLDHTVVSGNEVHVTLSRFEESAFYCDFLNLDCSTSRGITVLAGCRSATILECDMQDISANVSVLSLLTSSARTIAGSIELLKARNSNVYLSVTPCIERHNVENCIGALKTLEATSICLLCGEEYRERTFDGCCKKCTMKNYTHQVTYWNTDDNDGLPSFGVELELCYGGTIPDDAKKLSVELIRAGWARCSDGSVDVEFKSPIFTSLDQLKPSYALMQSAYDLGYINDECGTHFHVGTSDGLLERFRVNDRYGVQVFKDLTDHMLENREHTQKTYGRDFCSYAEPTVYPRDRYSWLNVSDEHGHNTVECRLPRLHTIAAYEKLLVFWRERIEKLTAAHRYGNWSTSNLSEELVRKYQEIFA